MLLKASLRREVAFSQGNDGRSSGKLKNYTCFLVSTKLFVTLTPPPDSVGSPLAEGAYKISVTKCVKLDTTGVQVIVCHRHTIFLSLTSTPAVSKL